MEDDPCHNRRCKARKFREERRKPAPLDAERLNELALAYVARFATTAAKLETYLRRKIRERGWDDGVTDENARGWTSDSGPDLSALAARFVDLGYIDDEAYARSKSGGLLRRGYGPRRVAQALGAAGIAKELSETMQPDGAAERQAVLIMARKRRFGPFGQERPDRKLREKQIAAMLRAGHRLDNIRQMLDAETSDAAEQWAAATDGFED